MIITCPSCTTQFFVPDDKIGPQGRRVRCAKCSETWLQEKEAAAKPRARAAQPALDDDDPFASAAYDEKADADDLDFEQQVAALADAPDPEVKADDLPDLDVPPAPQRRGGWVGWVLLVLVLVGLGAGAYAARQPVVDFWPPAARAYQLAGLPVREPAMYGLSIKNVTSERAIDSGQRVLLVSGDVVNDAQQAKSLPRLRVALTDGGGKEIYFWTVTLAKPELGPDETVRFSTRLPNPPDAAKSLAVRFAF
jgi:predicted Zn finger-like uncharacterized protein